LCGTRHFKHQIFYDWKKLVKPYLHASNFEFKFQILQLFGV
jgi:hypothetical protein